MELEPHPLHEDVAVVRFFDADEYMVAVRGLLASSHGADKLKGVQLRARPIVDKLTGRIDARVESAYTRETTFKDEQLHRLDLHLAEREPHEKDNEDVELDIANIRAAIRSYFGTELPE